MRERSRLVVVVLLALATMGAGVSYAASTAVATSLPPAASAVPGANSGLPAPARVGGDVSTTLARDGAVNVFVMLDGARTGSDISTLKQNATKIEDRVLSSLPPGVEVDHRLQTVPAFSARVSSAAQLAALAEQPGVARIDLADGGGTGSVSRTVNIIGADLVQSAGYTGAGVTVAVLDSGVDSTHPDLAGSVIDQACFGEDFAGGFCPNGTTRHVGPGSAIDDAGHGTHVTGIIRSAGQVSGVGVAPASSIVAIKVTDGCSFGGCFYTFVEITAALDYLVAHPEFGVDVVNMSLATNATFSGDCDSSASYLMAAATSIANLRAAGVLPVASSGNDSEDDTMSAPACLSGVLSVAASDATDTMAFFANISATTDMVAPGVGVVSDAIGGSTTTASGTSMASPAVAGCVALLREARPAATIGAFENALKSTGRPITRGTHTLPRVACERALTGLGVPVFRITTATLPSGSIGTPYSTTLSASGGIPPYRWKKIGLLPKGVKLRAKTGVISGSPKRSTGTFTFTVQASYKTKVPGQPAIKRTASRVLSITVT